MALEGPSWERPLLYPTCVKLLATPQILRPGETLWVDERSGQNDVSFLFDAPAKEELLPKGQPWMGRT
jgi:hypothetical protein